MSLADPVGPDLRLLPLCVPYAAHRAQLPGGRGRGNARAPTGQPGRSTSAAGPRQPPRSRGPEATAPRPGR